ncbi:MAG: alpha/beta hydrolase-fold protein [Armatimonadota bacterium]
MPRQNRLEFRLRAPGARSVRLGSPDIQGVGKGEMTRDATGNWTLAIDGVVPGAYRYRFVVDGVETLDPANGATAESLGNAWSLVLVAGSPLFDLRDVPHGAVSRIPYRSTVVDGWRRAHVYTPPGYESGKGTFPILHLLHGSGDTDDAWTSVGRAAMVFDNLIADGKMVPAIVAMPAGHTRPAGTPAPDGEFVRDFLECWQPLVESRFRVRRTARTRAVAGLSMGGFHSMELLAARPDDFGTVGIFSAGIGGLLPRPGRPAVSPPWEETHRDALARLATAKTLRKLWIGIGKDDFLLETSRATDALLTRHKVPHEHVETSGGHTWLVWRDYLSTFAPACFR